MLVVGGRAGWVEGGVVGVVVVIVRVVEVVERRWGVGVICRQACSVSGGGSVIIYWGIASGVDVWVVAC